MLKPVGNKCSKASESLLRTRERLMSALGQKRALRGVRPMSALPPKADIETQPRDVRYVPKADMRRRPVSQVT